MSPLFLALVNARAQAVADTARNLVALEAEDAYLRWEEADLQITDTRQAAEEVASAQAVGG